MGYCSQVMRTLRAAAAAARERGPRAACDVLLTRVFSRSRTYLYQRAAGGPVASAPQDLRIVRLDPEQRAACLSDLVRAGAGPELGLLRADTIGYLAYWHGAPVGSGWRYPHSRLLRRLRQPQSAAYLGGFYVLPEARGRGIYPALLRTMCCDAGAPSVLCFAQTSLDNLSSQRGLTKAGFERLGELRVLVLAGLIVACRLRGAADPIPPER